MKLRKESLIIPVIVLATHATAVTIIDFNQASGSEGAAVTRLLGSVPGGSPSPEYYSGCAAGDWNGDGHLDFFFGVPWAHAPGRNSAGVGTIVFGPIDPQVSPMNLDGMGSLPQTRILGESATDRFGYSASSGDFDGDGRDDLAVGARQASFGPASAGGVYVFRGRCDFPAGETIDLAATPTDANLTTIFAYGQTYQLGGSLSVGDFNSDGYSDLAVGGPAYRRNGAANTGIVYMLSGANNFFGNDVDLLASAPSIATTRFLGSTGGDFTGNSLSSGDVNGDGFDDLVIGASSASPPGGLNQPGLVYVFYGSTGFKGLDFDLALPTGTFGETRILGTSAGDISFCFGAGVACADVDNDGYADIAGGAVAGRGTVHLVFGGPGKPGTPILIGSQLELIAPGNTRIFRFTGRDSSGRLGISFALTDYQGDGYIDIASGAFRGKNGTIGSAGNASMFFWNPSLEGQHITLINAEEDLRLLGDNSQDEFGVGGEGGFDINSDGAADLSFTTLPFDGPVGANTGATYIVYGETAFVETTARQWYRAGAAPQRGMGGALSPVLRAWIGFLSGAVAECEAAIVRNAPATTELEDVLPVYWLISSERGNLIGTLRYLDSELGTVDENKLSLFRAETPAGPWARVESQALLPDMNLVHFTSETTGYFALATANQESQSCGAVDAMSILGIPRLSVQNE